MALRQNSNAARNNLFIYIFFSFSLTGPSADVLRKQPLLNHKLNATEIAAVHQLVTGYHESAALTPAISVAFSL